MAYSHEKYLKYIDSIKKAAKKYRETHKEKYLKYAKDYYQNNKKECNRKSMEYRAKNPKWKQYAKECSYFHNNMLYPEEIPEMEYFGCIYDLNLKIEKEGFIYGSKC